MNINLVIAGLKKNSTLWVIQLIQRHETRPPVRKLIMHCGFYINKPQHLELLQAVIYCLPVTKSNTEDPLHPHWGQFPVAKKEAWRYTALTRTVLVQVPCWPITPLFLCKCSAVANARLFYKIWWECFWCFQSPFWLKRYNYRSIFLSHTGRTCLASISISGNHQYTSLHSKKVTWYIWKSLKSSLTEKNSK